MNSPLFSSSKLVEKACALSNSSSLHILLAYSGSIFAAGTTAVSIPVLDFILSITLVRVRKISLSLVVPCRQRKRQSRNTPEQSFDPTQIERILKSHRLWRDQSMLESTTRAVIIEPYHSYCTLYMIATASFLVCMLK